MKNGTVSIEPIIKTADRMALAKTIGSTFTDDSEVLKKATTKNTKPGTVKVKTMPTIQPKTNEKLASVANNSQIVKTKAPQPDKVAKFFMNWRIDEK